MRFILLFVFVHVIDGAKILLYTPSVSPSHIVMSGRMADVLVNAGHDVVLFIPEYDNSITINGTLLAKVWRMSNIGDAFMKGFEDIGASIFEQAAGTPEDRLIFEEVAGQMCEAIMARVDELNVLRDYGFDVVFTEMIDLCGLGIMRYLGIRNHIWHSTTPLHDYVAYNLGVPSPVSYVSTTEENLLGPKMTFSERVYNMYMYFVTVRLHYYGTDKATQAIRKYAGPDFPTVRQIASESTICFVNSDEFLDPARPILHKTIYIGGLGINDPKPVVEPFNSLLESAKDGVVLFSLGTICPTSLMRESLKKEIIQVFKQMPSYQFIVKCDKDDAVFREIAKDVANVHMTSWMPQSDILGDPRVKLFITHGGYNSLIEATIRAKPLIVIPMYADQFKNAKTVEYRGTGIVIEKLKLSETTLKRAIEAIFTQPQYQQSVDRISTLIKNKPFKPEETFVRWTNFVAEQGLLPELTPEGTHMSFITYFCVDVIAFFLSMFSVSVFVVCYFCKKIYTTAKVKHE